MWSIHSHYHRQVSPSSPPPPQPWRVEEESRDKEPRRRRQEQPRNLPPRGAVLSPRQEEAFLRQLLADDEDNPASTTTLYQHVVLPHDTFAGICVRYKLSPLALRRANGGFSGSNLSLAPAVLHIPVEQDSGVTPQDTTSAAYKLQVVRVQFPTLSAEQATA